MKSSPLNYVDPSGHDPRDVWDNLHNHLPSDREIDRMGTDFYEQWSELYRNAKTNDQRWELIDFKDAFLQYTDGTLIQDISDFIMDHPAYAIGAGGGSCDDRCYRRNWRNSSHYRCTICISRGSNLGSRRRWSNHWNLLSGIQNEQLIK